MRYWKEVILTTNLMPFRSGWSWFRNVSNTPPAGEETEAKEAHMSYSRSNNQGQDYRHLAGSQMESDASRI